MAWEEVFTFASNARLLMLYADELTMMMMMMVF